MDKDRRKFLKILLIGSTSFIAGKILGPLLSNFFDHSFTKDNAKTAEAGSSSEHFRVVENKQILSVYDNSGEEIFQIDKGA